MLLTILIQSVVTGLVGLVISLGIRIPIIKYLNKKEIKDNRLSQIMKDYYSLSLKKVDLLTEIIIVIVRETNNNNPEVLKLIDNLNKLDREFKEKTANKMAGFSNSDI